MLRSLTVADFAIIDRAELVFGPGMTVLSGETGAGKSLIVDALTLLGGGRADAGVVRAGAARAELGAEFALEVGSRVRAALAELELDDEAECRLRRVVRADGTSRAFINDRSVTLATLKRIAEDLFEIHGQHEHQALLARASQLALLDAHGGHGAARTALAAHVTHWRRLEDEITSLRGRAGTSGELIELLRFQVEELGRDALAPEALAALEDEHRRLSHAGELIKGCSGLAELIDGEHDYAVRVQLQRAAADLARLRQLDPRLSSVDAAIDGAVVQIDEAMTELQRYLGANDLDPERLETLDAQLGRIHELARKHRVHARELKPREASLRAEFESIAGADERLAKLVDEQREVRTRYDADAAKLATLRRAAAKKLAKQIGQAMGELGMAGGKFEVEFEALTGAAPSAQGTDAVEFLVSANPGQPPRPMRKVASGGELSRIGLAIEVAALGKDEVATMVFDEVDAGIGGAVAEVVGRKLKDVAAARQVLCVTHLPQVAAQADHHIGVRKASEAGATRTLITQLAKPARLDELARMLGGIEITRETRAHAEAMLKRAQSR
ncbi:MAG TPA: DNA repair protein RecN [Candidatus Saccharimonadia bacterium]|nr:DNA repair protein RecN [Candidatus Saccharimonadia bacterium]